MVDPTACQLLHEPPVPLAERQFAALRVVTEFDVGPVGEAQCGLDSGSMYVYASRQGT